jgi:hypothetical protein
MSDWKSVLKADATSWLLEEDNPSVRYLTLVDILEKPANDPEVVRSGKEIMRSGAVPGILDKMDDRGCWENPDAFYTAKYKGTVWQLIILSALAADGKDDRITKACEFLLENSQDRGSGGFAMHRSARAGGGRPSEVIPCLTGNMIYSLIRLGYLSDPRVRRGIDWITRCQRFDDNGAPPPQGRPYDRYEICWGKHSCHMGVVKTLKALAEIPAADRSAEIERTLREGAEYLLRHHIFKKSHDISRVSKPGWLRFGFPLMYQTDILEILQILTRLGYHDERMQEAVDVVLRTQDTNGTWKLASTFNGRFQVNIEAKGKPGKFVTLNALKILKKYYG